MHTATEGSNLESVNFEQLFSHIKAKRLFQNKDTYNKKFMFHVHSTIVECDDV